MEKPSVFTKEPRSVVVSGIGGIGKTQLVRTFIDANVLPYKNIIWIDSNESKTKTWYRLARDVLKIPTTNADNRPKQFKSVIEEILNQLCKRKTLFVLDDVENFEIIKMLIMSASKGEIPHFIITTRSQNWKDEMNTIQLKVWDYDDAVAYVSKRLGTIILYPRRFSEEEKMLLVKKLHCFPLALRQAVDYIKDQRNFGITEYINKYDKHTQEMLDSKICRSFELYNETTFTTWNRTIDDVHRVESVGPLAVEILNIIAYFSPNNITKDFFCTTPETTPFTKNAV